MDNKLKTKDETVMPLTTSANPVVDVSRAVKFYFVARLRAAKLDKALMHSIKAKMTAATLHIKACVRNTGGETFDTKVQKFNVCNINSGSISIKEVGESLADEVIYWHTNGTKEAS